MNETQPIMLAREVDFYYGPSKALSQINIEILPQKVTALIGRTGCGKSTFLRCLNRMNDTIPGARVTGTILLDGEDMNTLDLRSYRQYLSVVPQESILFDGTLRENVLYGVKHIDEESLQRILKAANVLEFVENLPDGLDTDLGENGVRFSGGQKQRIAIARALVRNPRVLVLDETTSALDLRPHPRRGVGRGQAALPSGVPQSHRRDGGVPRARREAHPVDREDPAQGTGVPARENGNEARRLARALAEIAKVGFDPVFGARPLKRAIQHRIENPVARLILEGRFGPNDVIPVDVRKGEFEFGRVVH